jgi:hypothetical protein
LDTYADELDGEGWHNAANGCRHAIVEIERLRAALRNILAGNGGECGCAETARAVLEQSMPPKCEGCGVNYSDPPSRLCPGCEAYQGHQQ